MKYIYALIIILVVFTSGVLIAKNHYSTQDFLDFQQYDPQYITYDHEEMLYECEKHNLEYYFEDGTCIDPSSSKGLD